MVTTSCDAAPHPLQLCPMIRAEYLEMPGLNLTVPQAARLWGTEPWLCRDAFDLLVGSGFLRKAAGDRYIRADSMWR